MNINVAQLSSDGLSEVQTQEVFTSTTQGLEGSRMYQINGKYYIFNDTPNTEYVLQSDSPFGPYTQKVFESDVTSPVSGGGVPHQVCSFSHCAKVGFNETFRVASLTPLTEIGIIWPSLIATLAVVYRF